jgi:hypothetical protein
MVTVWELVVDVNLLVDAAVKLALLIAAPGG